MKSDFFEIEEITQCFLKCKKTIGQWNNSINHCIFKNLHICLDDSVNQDISTSQYLQKMLSQRNFFDPVDKRLMKCFGSKLRGLKRIFF